MTKSAASMVKRSGSRRPGIAKLAREIVHYLRSPEAAQFVVDTRRRTDEASKKFGNAYAGPNGYNHQLYVDANRAAEIVASLGRAKKEAAMASRRAAVVARRAAKKSAAQLDREIAEMATQQRR